MPKSELYDRLGLVVMGMYLKEGGATQTIPTATLGTISDNT